MSKTKERSFTLIELLVVISVIGMLSSIVLVSMKGAREKARIAKVQEQINTIVKAMKMYEIDVGELPPRGDSCPACCYPNCQGEWDRVMNALLNNDGPGWNGPYISAPISKDPWGHHFYYDDNACRSNCGNSYLGSAGPDGIIWTADDIRVIVTPYSEVIGCCY
jgi:general secretion pathway protein G